MSEKHPLHVFSIPKGQSNPTLCLFYKPAQQIQISQISLTYKQPSFNPADSRLGTSGAKVVLWFLHRVC